MSEKYEIENKKNSKLSKRVSVSNEDAIMIIVNQSDQLRFLTLAR